MTDRSTENSCFPKIIESDPPRCCAELGARAALQHTEFATATAPPRQWLSNTPKSNPTTTPLSLCRLRGLKAEVEIDFTKGALAQDGRKSQVPILC